jgi:glutaminase
MDSQAYIRQITTTLEEAIALSRENQEGRVAAYIPELANVDQDYLSGAIILSNGTLITSGDSADHLFTIQSVGKLVLLIALMEEYGPDHIFTWINAEPSGQSFASLERLEQSGTIPANPLVNAGAIALTAHIKGSEQEKINWLNNWVERLFGEVLSFDNTVFESEQAAGDKNRALAYLMKSTGVLKGDVNSILNTYFMTCSYQANIKQSAYLPLLLANGGLSPSGKRVFSEETSNHVVSIMSTCGLYNESGMHLVRTGMPAKTGVSGLVVAVATGRGGVAVFSPRLNSKGSSIRGLIALRHISQALDWHFASPWGYAFGASTRSSES